MNGRPYRLLLPFVCLAALAALFVPVSASATVAINEIAWMGGVSSANHEWIELHNFGSEAVSVEGWSLSDGNNLNISLTGMIGPGVYAVLERTSDASAPGAAFLIYTGALVNGGATLTLRDEAGTIVDQVVGGEDWQNIGGDNASKDTAQYTDSGWITAAPTPGRANATTPSPASQTGTQTTARRSILPDSPPATDRATPSLELSDAELSLDLTVPDVVYVNQPVSFDVTASGINDLALNSLWYHWNFGDAHATGGKSVKHSYAYPGEYVVSVEAEYNRHRQVARKTLLVLPTTFSLTKNERGDVQIHNDSPYEVLIEGFQLIGLNTVTFPTRTIVMPRGTITLAREKLGNAYNTITSLVDSSGQMIASTAMGSQSEAESSSGERAAATPPPSPATTQASTGFGFASAEGVAEIIATTSEVTLEAEDSMVMEGEEGGMSDEGWETISNPDSATDTVPTDSSQRWAFLALLGVIGVSLTAIYATSTRRQRFQSTEPSESNFP